MFVFIVYRTVSYFFERLFKPSGTGPNVLKTSVYNNEAISSDIWNLRQIATAAFSPRTWDSDTWTEIISSAAESKIIVCNLPFENQLFGYIHYCTENPETNINLLPNTCNFHRKFGFIFSLYLTDNAQNVHFREAKFQNFPGEHVPGRSQCTRAFGARYYFYRSNSELLRPGLLLPLSNTQYNDYVSYVHKRNVSFLSKKGCTFRIIQRCRF